MSTSFSNVNPTNMELAPMRVNFNGVDLGGTLSNVVISTKFIKANIMADQLGKTVIDRRVSALEITVTTELAEVQNKDNWKVVFPHMQEVTQAITGGKLGYFQSMIGDSDIANAKQLVLHPLSKVDADLTENYLFYKAVASAESEITYSPEKQAVLKIVWNILPDFTTKPARFFIYGDPSIGLVSATVSSPSFSGSGNGTLTNAAVFNGVTVTETITATCVTSVPSGGVFNVNGSISGPHGLAVVGVNYVSPVISFLINAGTSNFQVNDVFTLTTTASNFS